MCLYSLVLATVQFQRFEKGSLGWKETVLLFQFTSSTKIEITVWKLLNSTRYLVNQRASKMDSPTKIISAHYLLLLHCSAVQWVTQGSAVLDPFTSSHIINSSLNTVHRLGLQLLFSLGTFNSLQDGLSKKIECMVQKNRQQVLRFKNSLSYRIYCELGGVEEYLKVFAIEKKKY